MASGLREDKRYSSCCFMGARSKSQCLRHNLQEIKAWPVLDCHHIHDPKEWEPTSEHGRRVYPSHEEAEYTAIAVAASWWAGRTGRATLHVPRMPAINCHGRREHWLALDPRCMREWAMAPLAISLGLKPPDAREAARVPKRGRVSDFIQDDKTLPAECVYVGRGHHSHRIPVTGDLLIPVVTTALQKNGWLGMWVTYVHLKFCGQHYPSYVGRRWCAIAPGKTCAKRTFLQDWCLRRHGLLLMPQSHPEGREP